MTQPVKKFGAEQVSCALLENEAKVGDRVVTMLKATVERRYRDSAGNWKNSGSLSRNETPLAIYGLKKAFVAMVEEKASGDAYGGA